ncbi:MAG: hypothetical protein WCH01_01770, partial [Methylococcaceae bacterium]
FIGLSLGNYLKFESAFNKSVLSAIRALRCCQFSKIFFLLKALRRKSSNRPFTGKSERQKARLNQIHSAARIGGRKINSTQLNYL